MFARSRSAFAPFRGARAFSATARTGYARITLIGHLAATPELEGTSTGSEIVRFSLASQHGPKDNRQTSWWRVTSFMNEGPRRHLLTSLPKGSLLFVEGDARMRQYQDAEGRARNTLDIVERNFEVLRSPASQEAESRSETAM